MPAPIVRNGSQDAAARMSNGCLCQHRHLNVNPSARFLENTPPSSIHPAWISIGELARQSFSDWNPQSCILGEYLGALFYPRQHLRCIDLYYTTVRAHIRRIVTCTYSWSRIWQNRDDFVETRRAVLGELLNAVDRFHVGSRASISWREYIFLSLSLRVRVSPANLRVTYTHVRNTRISVILDFRNCVIPNIELFAPIDRGNIITSYAAYAKSSWIFLLIL